MKPFKVIADPTAFELLADDTRRRIIYLLRAKELTVSQIAAELSLTPQAIYHHIRKLRESDMVEVAREERVDHFIETYYRATAEIFYLSHGEPKSPQFAENKTREVVQALGKLGFPMRTDPETVAKIADLERRLQKVGMKDDWIERIGEVEGIDFLTKQDVAHYAKLLSMTEKEFEEYSRLTKELRGALKRGLEEPPKA